MKKNKEKEIRPICDIAADIRRTWKNVSPHAEPYLRAMNELMSYHDTYGLDSASGIILRFLCNASGWRGEAEIRISAGSFSSKTLEGALKDLREHEGKLINELFTLRVDSIHRVRVDIRSEPDFKLKFKDLRIVHPEEVNFATGGYAHWHDDGLTENQVIRLLRALEGLQGY